MLTCLRQDDSLSMALERDMNLKIITEVKKYECLFNFHLPDYSKKDVTERAWSKVSKKMNLPVHECKDKWKNIRSALVRSLKPNASSKFRKPYYLHDHLVFILPYVKHIPNIQEKPPETQMIKTEDTVIYDDEASSLLGSLSNDDHQSEDDSNSLPSTTRTKRKADDSDETLLDYPPNKKENSNTTDDETAKRYFLLSLLPELRGLTEDQMRHFKIQALLLIDSIKGGSMLSQSSTYSPRNSMQSSVSVTESSYSPSSKNDPLSSFQQ